jgi:UDP-N-acetylmuramate dehydrogenase
MMAAAIRPADDQLAVLQERLGTAARRAEPLARHTSIRVGGPADLFFVARSPDDLRRAVDEAHRLGVPWRIIGGGSNLLIADAGIEGLVVKATAPGAEIRLASEGNVPLVEADAGAVLAAVGKQAALRGLAGLEWAVNVPGTVGASVVNNSGAFGSCVSEHLIRATLFDPVHGTRTIGADTLTYGYRTSSLKRGDLTGVVLTATYRVALGDRGQLRARIAEIQATRRATQPTGYSLGSMFANPPGDAAGRLIEQSGLKGHRVGHAEVSELHGNFIVNRGHATAQHVAELMCHIQDVVWRTAKVWLTPEVQLVGRFDPSLPQRLHTAPEGTP